MNIPVIPKTLRLTKTERRVAEVASRGLSYKEMAFELGVKDSCVKSHMRNIFRVNQLKNRHELAIAFMTLPRDSIKELPGRESVKSFESTVLAEFILAFDGGEVSPGSAAFALRAKLRERERKNGGPRERM